MPAVSIAPPVPPRPVLRSLLAAALLAACASAPKAAPAAGPQAAAPGLALSFEAARERVLEHSNTLAAARAGAQAKAWQERGLKPLGGPTVALTGLAYAYNANLQVDLDPLNQSLGQIGAALPPWAQGVVSQVPIPQLPGSYTLNRHGTGSQASVAAVWPIYLGGATDAARGLVAAQQREAEADAEQAGLDVQALLVQRYFGAQLARRAAELRRQAEQTIALHDAAAQKMLDEGVISRVERLQASAAHAEARRNTHKAESDAELAAAALARSVAAEAPVTPLTPLFVLATPIEPLGHFIDSALAQHPGLAKIAARKAQAEQLHAGGQALRRPQVIAFGSHELRSGSRANWAAGLGLRWTLYDSVDRDALDAASQQQIEQARLTDAQARSDIALLVESHWRAVENHRREYLEMAQAVALADEVVRLRQAGLREGASTTLDLIDAETNRAKVLTERAQVANQYVQALAQLLQVAGRPEQLADYIARAELQER